MNTERLRLRIYIAVFTAILLAGVFGFMIVEKLSLIDALYFSIVTMATVGYGDIHPHTMAGKILSIALIIGGVGTFLGVVASITELFLKRREEAFRRQKLNMVAGLFFSELGSGLLRQFCLMDPDVDDLYLLLKVSNDWTNDDFQKARQRVAAHSFSVDARRGDLTVLRSYLKERSNFLLRMLENPMLQEHGVFTELLRAVFHLRDELLNRHDLSGLVDSDRRHLEGDIMRIYRLLVIAWLDHMRYLKDNYGYLLSLAMRVNPFDPQSSAVVVE
jgi:voltage-gated potassium channel